MAVSGLNDNLKMLGDLAQGDKGKFQELTSIFAKVQNTGRATQIQLQQLALRGIPIQKTLKEMGVTGVASAEQLTQAFQKLTGEGGQFHDAMNNIIDTIEGKQGFITDTIKEILVNFGELSGLTDTYKSLLDIVYNILDKVNNKLREWNENPVMKAIIQGVFATALTALVTIIGVSLVGALTTVITKLGIIAALKTAINPAGLLVGLGIAGTVGIVAGLTSLSKSEQEATDKAKKLNEELERTQDLMSHKPMTAETQNLTTQLENETHLLDGYKSLLETQQQNLEDAQQKVMEIEKKMKADGGGLTGYESRWKRAQEEVEKYSTAVDKATNFVTTQEKAVKHLQDTIAKGEGLAKLKETFDTIYNNTIPQTQKELTEINTLLGQVKNYEKEIKALNGTPDKDGKLISYDNAKKAIDDTVEYLNNKIKEIKVKIKIENAEEWQKNLQEVLGLDDNKTAELIGQNGSKWIEDYARNLSEQTRQIQKTYAAMGINQSSGAKDYASNQAQDLLKVLDALMQTGNFGVQENGLLDNTTQELMEQLNSLKQVFIHSGGTVEEWDAMLGNAKDKTEETVKYVAKSWKDYVSSLIAGTDVGSFAEKMKNGADWQTALFEVFMDDLVEVIGGFEQLQYVLNIVKNVVEAFTPLLKAVVNIVTVLGWVLKPVLDALNWLLNLIFGDFNKACDNLFNAMDEESDKRREMTRDLTSQYEALSKAIKEQEEYYIRKKAELNMLALDSKVTKVNDMILTPNGAFSTHPQDTIIATKNPEGLGGVVNNIKVINGTDSKVDVQERKGNGINEILIMISKKVAGDVAEGLNGWDGAMALQQQRISGRRI